MQRVASHGPEYDIRRPYMHSSVWRSAVGHTQKRPKCRYAAFGSTNARNHGMSFLRRDTTPEQHVSVWQPDSKRLLLRQIEGFVSSHLTVTIAQPLASSCQRFATYHHHSPARNVHSLLYCSQQHARAFISVQLAQSTPNSSHQATIVRQPGIAGAHGPCFIVPNGAWTICNARLVPASGRNTSFNPDAQQCHGNHLAPGQAPRATCQNPPRSNFVCI